MIIHKTLPPQWQDWLNTNIACQVPLATLAQTLSEHGFYDAANALLNKPTLSLPLELT